MSKRSSMLYPWRANTESAMGDKEAQNPFEATLLEDRKQLHTAAPDMNSSDVPETPISSVMDALTRPSDDTTQLSPRPLIPSPSEQHVEKNVTQFQQPFSR